MIPFSKRSNNEFIISVFNGVNNYNKYKTNIDFLPPSEANSIFELNNFINQKFTNNYYNINEFIKANFNSSKSFSILHLNIHSIKKHIEELRIVLILLNFKFDIIALSE